MTKEELEKEAEEKAKEFSEHPLKEFCKFPLHWTDFDKSKESCYMNGYLAGAEPREKRIAELERKLEQTEKDLTDYQFNYPKIKDLEKELETEKKLNAEIKVRFVKCNTCTDEMKSKCLMFSENLCEGDRCEELVDLIDLVNKSELQKENAELKEALAEQKQYIAFKCEDNKKIIDNLRQENAELKEKYSDNLSLKDEELMCLETDFNTYKSEAKELLNEFLDFESSCMERGIKISDKIRAKAEQFLKE